MTINRLFRRLKGHFVDSKVAIVTHTHLRTEDTPPPAGYRAIAIQGRFKDPVQVPGVYDFPSSINQVREDKAFYVPDFLSSQDGDPEAWSAAQRHAKHLLKAEGRIDEALNLVNLMLASLFDDSDSRAMQMGAGLRAVRNRLNKACRQIDKHDSRQTNLFLAYFDLIKKTDRGSED